MSVAFPIVGVGASAGGIEAMEGFFRGLPASPGLAVVIVTHLSPERESRLHEVIARYTDLPVEVAADGQKVECDHVYVLPADAILGIQDGNLRITRLSPGQRERKPIDIFFGELARDQGEHAAAVILSGGDGDGTLGIKVIKECGGLVLAQTADGNGPDYPDMPQTAIATGLVDFAVPAGEMGRHLVEFVRDLRLLDGIAADAAQADQARRLNDLRLAICEILRDQVGHDFSAYKSKTFLRRVRRRMHVAQLDTIEAYVEMLRADAQEAAALFRDLLIGVTSFFRDTDAFAALEAEVVPKLFEGRAPDDTVRIWVPGCATGEEVFSIAILLRECMDRLRAPPPVQIFATDIDERALAIARAARYPAALLDSVSPARRERFFIADGGSWVVAKEVRDLCVFSPHSVLRDPPFSRIDLISCRNLLIYLDSEAQRQVIPVFHFALRPDGFLFLGTSENTAGHSDLFAPVEQKQRIFRRRGGTAPQTRLPMAMNRLRLAHTVDPQARRAASGGFALRQAVEGQVLERFAPPFVVVNRDGDIVFFSARTGRFLEAAPGSPTRQLLGMVRKGLRLDVRAALREAVQTGEAVTRAGVPVDEADGHTRLVTLTVEPLRDHDHAEKLFLVLFDEEAPGPEPDKPGERPRAQEDAVRHLEQELRETRERLQSLVEEYETAVEELKASNEELVSLNEEMQSTNEELEASKEELQSVNEELHTVNHELQTKVEALDRANDDLRNLFDTTDVASIFLDSARRIRSFTPAATQVFNLLPTDRGRPISDLSSRIDQPDLDRDIAAVLENGQPIERRLEHHDGRTFYLVRFSPYRNSNGRIDGVVISFVDVTGLTRAESHQRLLVAELQHRTRNLLNVVQAIVVQTLGRQHTPQALTARLAALGRAQGLISESQGGEVDVSDLIRLELNAYANSADGRVEIVGPSVLLAVEHVQILALALHELTTNAVKHGALHGPRGRLAVGWRLQDGEEGRRLVLDWRESGVAIATNDPPRGFGRELIERALAYSAQARTELTFAPDGVKCHIELPLAH